MPWFKNTKTGGVFHVDSESRLEKDLTRNPDFIKLGKKQLAEEKARFASKKNLFDEDETEEILTETSDE